MSKSMKKTTLLWSALLIGAICVAADYGSYLCKSCKHPMSPPDISAFVRVFVNRNVGRWSANDTFNICDGSFCVKYLTPHAEAIAWQAIGVFPDPGFGYKGEGESITHYTPFGMDPNDFIQDFLDGWYRIVFDPSDGHVIVGEIEYACDEESRRTGRIHRIGACP